MGESPCFNYEGDRTPFTPASGSSWRPRPFQLRRGSEPLPANTPASVYALHRSVSTTKGRDPLLRQGTDPGPIHLVLGFNYEGEGSPSTRRNLLASLRPCPVSTTKGMIPFTRARVFCCSMAFQLRRGSEPLLPHPRAGTAGAGFNYEGDRNPLPARRPAGRLSRGHSRVSTTKGSDPLPAWSFCCAFRRPIKFQLRRGGIPFPPPSAPSLP